MAEAVAHDYCFNVILIGDQGGIGKTTLLSRFADDSYQDTHKITIGLDFKIKKISIDNKLVKIIAWDS